MVVERHRQSITAKIVVAAALVQNATGELLLVRKGGTERFMLPVGKIEPGETLCKRWQESFVKSSAQPRKLRSAFPWSFYHGGR